jgi:hypothetical protein
MAAIDFKFDFLPGRIRSAWNSVLMCRGKPLTDARIAHYQKLGHYSLAVKAARREAWEKKRQERVRKDGNFVRAEGGRLLFRPE